MKESGGAQEGGEGEAGGSPDLEVCRRAPVLTRFPSGERTPMLATPTFTTLLPGYMSTPTASFSSPALNTSCAPPRPSPSRLLERAPRCVKPNST